MSFYQDLHRFAKEKCPIVCIHSDLNVDAYIDIPIEDIIKLFQMDKGYEWDEEKGLRDFESKVAIQDIHADDIGECLKLFTAAPEESPYRFITIKNPHASLKNEFFQRQLKNAADKIISAKSHRMIIIICASEQLLPKTTSKYIKDQVNKHIKYLELNESARFEIRNRLFGMDLLSECPGCSEQIHTFKEKAGFDDTNDEIAFIQSLQEMVKTSEIYDSICQELKVDEQYKIEGDKKDQRNRSKPQLRERLGNFLENVTHSDLSPFVDNNGKIVRIPKSEAPIIQMLISASKSSNEEDWLIENWVMGKYENPKEEEFGEIYVLYQILEKRINELYSKDEIDSLTKDRWITYLKRKLNYDSISALSRFQTSVNGLIESSKPLTLFLNRDIILESPVQTTAAEKEFLIQKIIETFIAPLLVTQQDYLLFATKVLDILNQSAIKKSEKVLEYVLAQSKK